MRLPSQQARAMLSLMPVTRIKENPYRFTPVGPIVIKSPSPAHLAAAKEFAEADARRAGCVVTWKRHAPNACTARGVAKPVS